MDEFKPIESQEELNAAIKTMLGKLREDQKSELSELKAQLEELEAQHKELEAQAGAVKDVSGKAEEIEALKAKVTGYENAAKKRAIVNEFKLPEELAERLQGETPEEWRADALRFKSMFHAAYNVPPLADLSGSGDNSNGLREMLARWKGY